MDIHQPIELPYFSLLSILSIWTCFFMDKCFKFVHIEKMIFRAPYERLAKTWSITLPPNLKWVKYSQSSILLLHCNPIFITKLISLMKSEYQPHIDILRALAVLLVIFNHLDFTLFSGGFIGVDVFLLFLDISLQKILCQKKVNPERFISSTSIKDE